MKRYKSLESAWNWSAANRLKALERAWNRFKALEIEALSSSEICSSCYRFLKAIWNIRMKIFWKFKSTAEKMKVRQWIQNVGISHITAWIVTSIKSKSECRANKYTSKKYCGTHIGEFTSLNLNKRGFHIPMPTSLLPIASIIQIQTHFYFYASHLN